MTVAEQETLFKQVQEKFSGMSNRWHSGYVAGVVDADKDFYPAAVRNTEYEAGYRSGYVDAAGMDALDSFPECLAPAGQYDFSPRWWEQAA